MRHLPLYKFQCEPHHEICRWENAVLSAWRISQDFSLSERSAFRYFGSTGRFISFIGTCQVRGALLLAWRYQQFLHEV